MKGIIDIIKSPLVAISGTVSAIFIAAAIQWSRTEVPLTYLGIGLGIVAFFLIFNIVVVMLFGRASKQEELDEKIADLKHIMLESNMSWLVNEKYVAAVESDSSETWVFTPFMKSAMQQQGDLESVTQANLNKGYKYVYFTTNRPRNRKAISDFKTQFKYEQDQVQFYMIPPEDFLFVSEVIVCNVGSTQERAIQYLPVVKLPYFIEMDELHTDRVVGIAQMFMDAHEPFSERRMKEQAKETYNRRRSDRAGELYAEKLDQTEPDID